MRTARELLAGLRSRARFGIVVEALGCLAAAAAVYVFVSYGLDRTLRLEPVFRAALLLGFGVVAARLYWRRLHRPIRVELTDAEIALAIERRDPAVRQALISALDFDAVLTSGRHRGESVVLMREVVEDVERRVKGFAFHRAVDGQRIARFATLFVGVVALVGAWVLAAPEESALWARRNLAFSNEPWPRDTLLAFVGSDPAVPLRVAERDDVRVRVRADGVVPEEVELRIRFAGGERAVRQMERTGEREFATTLEALLEDAEVVARGGDGETLPLRITLVPRPRVTRLDLVLHHPAYLERPATPLDVGGGDVRMPLGGALELSAVVSKPLSSARLDFAQEVKIPATIGADRTTLHARIEPETNGILRLDILDEDGYGPVEPPQLFLRIVPDSEPGVDFRIEGIGTLITSQARIPGVVKLRDDYGLESVEASFRTMSATPPENGTAAVEPPFAPAEVQGLEAFVAGETDLELPVVFDLLPLARYPDPNSEDNPVHPGQLLSLVFEARDGHQPTPHVGRSEVFNFRVVTREELLEELQRRRTEQRRELEEVQKAETEARALIAEIVVPAADDPRLAEVHSRLRTVARQQVALGKKCLGISERYRRVLDEMLNNRLFEPNVTRRLDAMIVAPLATLALQDFPESAERTAGFAEAPTDASRAETLAAYDRILAAIERILAQMEEADSIAALVEALRTVIRTEAEAGALLEELRGELGAEILDPVVPKNDTNPGGRGKE